MQKTALKQTGDVYGVDEFNNTISQELQSVVSNTDQTFDPGDSEQLAQGVVKTASAILEYNDSGTTNSYVLTKIGFIALPFYVEGMTCIFKVVNTNTGASTVNVDGLGVAPLMDGNGNDLLGGELVADLSAEIIYLNNVFVLVNESTTDAALAVDFSDDTPGSEGSKLIGHTNESLYNVLPRAFGRVSEASGVYTLENSYNITSISKSSTGVVDITFDEDMSTATYNTLLLLEDNGGILPVTISTSNLATTGFTINIGEGTGRSEQGFSFSVMEVR